MAVLIKSFGNVAFARIYRDFIDKTVCHGSRYRYVELRIGEGK